MKTLLVDNGSAYIEPLKVLCGEHDLIGPTQLPSVNPADYSLVLLSGGFKHEVEGHDEYYRHELNLVRTCPVPLIGVCLGLQLIAHAYGAKLVTLDRTEHGTISIMPTWLGAHLFPKRDIKVFESHRFVVRKLPKELDPLAISRDGVESLKHATRPVYGFQFHPEKFVNRNDGHLIYRSVIHDALGPLLQLSHGHLHHARNYHR